MMPERPPTAAEDEDLRRRRIERIAFEAWAKREGYSLRGDLVCYDDIHTQPAWEGWQARAKVHL